MLGVRGGQIVVTQVAVALLVAALDRDALVSAGAALVAVLVLPVAWVRVRGRWLFEWLGIAAGHLTRRRVLPPTAAPAAVLTLVAPDTAVRTAELAGDPAAVLDDPDGLTALLELADPGGPLGDGARMLPSPASLLPPAGPDTPPLRIQLLFSASSAPAPSAGGSTVATSYRQLTEGRVPAREQVVLAVRVLRVDGWSDEDLRRSLSGAVRKMVRRLGPVTARPLGVDAALRVLGELAHHDDGQPARESWQTVRLGGLSQATFGLRRWPAPGVEGGRQLVPRLLGLPTTATTVALCAGPRDAGPHLVPVELSVRLAAGPGDLPVAEQALRRLVGGLGGEVRRLDGHQLPGLAATLPLARAGAGAALPADRLDGLDLPLGAAGLMIGVNRHGDPVTLRVFRPEATRLVLVGGVRAAQLVVLRALALGARVVVRTARPRVWEPFVRGVGVPGGAVLLLPPGRSSNGPAGSPLHPLLLVVDAGPVAVDAAAGPGWQATLVVRDEVVPADGDALARADVAVLQPLEPAEAALADGALGLGGSAEWLTRIRPDMVAVVNRRALRWALLSPTTVESQLVGPPTRR